mmetsp:Transcript_8608/g.25418  ORF Transcript_8608/g.25418 Transcript_8608/m.25418 type:complete len:150 (+) Transcript_8608:20-469(+)
MAQCHLKNGRADGGVPVAAAASSGSEDEVRPASRPPPRCPPTLLHGLDVLPANATAWLEQQLPSGAPAEPIWPALATLLVAYVVARNFAAVYECVVDTLFVFAMQDKEEYGGVHMSDELWHNLGLAEKPPARRGAATAQQGADAPEALL